MTLPQNHMTLPQVRYWDTTGGSPDTATTVFVPGNPLAAGEVRVTGLQPTTNCSFQVAVVTSTQLVGVYSDPVTAVTLEEGKLHVHKAGLSMHTCIRQGCPDY